MMKTGFEPADPHFLRSAGRAPTTRWETAPVGVKVRRAGLPEGSAQMLMMEIF